MKYLGNTGLAKLIALINEKFAPLNSPAITGTPTAPTPAANDNSTRVATTEFVKGAISDIDIEKLTTEEIYEMFGITVPVVKTPLNLENYALFSIADYDTITTLPQANVEALTNIALATSTESAFGECYNLTSLSGVEQTWDTSNVTNMANMFNGCSSLISLDVSNWDTANVININSIFNFCEALTSLDVSNWDTANVTNMAWMFSDCSALTSLDMSNLDTSNVTDMKLMFANCGNLQYLIIGSSTFKFQLLSDTDLNNTCKILVPQALISTYQAAANWSDHASQFEPIENYTITKSNGQVTVTPNS